MEETKNDTKKFSTLYNTYFIQSKKKKHKIEGGLQFADIINRYNEKEYKLPKSVFSKNIFNESPLLMVDQKDINDYFNRQTFLNLDTKKPKRLERNNSLKYLRNINKCTLDLIQGQDTGPNVDAQMFQNKRNLRRRMREEKMALRWELHALHKDMRKNIEEIRETEETIINEFGPEKKPSNTVKKLKTIKEIKGTIQRNAMKKKLKIAPSLPIKKIVKSTRQSNKSLSTGCMSFTGMNSPMVSSPELTKVIKENVNNNKKVFNINQAQIIKAKSTSLLPIKSKLKKRVAPRNRQKEIVPPKVETVYNTIKQNIEKPKKDPKGEEKVNNLIKTFYTTRHSSIK